MVLVNSQLINKQIFTATTLPKTGDREDVELRVQGPDPKTDFRVPVSMTGTVLAIWGNPDPIETAETLGKAIFQMSGTSSNPPREGFWFDSYNSEGSINETEKKIYNAGTTPFIKNWEGPSPYIKSLGHFISQKINELDCIFTEKFGFPFFKSLEDIVEESQRVGDLNTVAKDNANYLYQVSILSAIIDHIGVKLNDEDDHLCSVCGLRHKQSLGSLQLLKIWLADKKLDSEKLTTTFQMIKKLRKQYPIHDHYITAKNIRQIRNEIKEANTFFGIIPGDYGHNAGEVVSMFGKSLDEIKEAILSIS